MGSRGLGAYVVARLLLAVPMLLILLTFVFLLLHVAPGDPVNVIAAPGASPEKMAELRQQLGLDRPLWEQYVDYLTSILTGDLGHSLQAGQRPVTQVIKETFPATLELTLAATAIALTVGIGVGTLAGAKRGGAADLAGRLFGIIVYSTPIFWLGLMGILVFAVLPAQSEHFQWLALPAGGRAGVNAPAHVTGFYVLDALIARDGGALKEVLRHLTLPALTLGLVISGIFIRITRVNMIQTMMADYVEAARARGVPERIVVLRHGFRNALIPVITLVGMTFALLLGGAVLTEKTFSWPGIASELTHAIEVRDYPLVQGITVFFATLIIGVSILIDLVNATIDPRVRY